MKSCGGVGVYIHSFLTSALDEVKGQFHALAAFFSGNGVPPYQLNKNQGGPQSQYEHFWGQTYLLPLPRTESWFVGHAARSLVTILTELSRLQVQQNRLKLYIFCSLFNNTVGNSGYRALNDRTVSKYDWVTMQKEALWPTLRY